MARTRLQYVIMGACVLITALFIIHEVLSLNKYGTSGTFDSIRKGRLFSSATVGIPPGIRTSGGTWNGSDGCHRLWIKGHSSYFDVRFNGSLSPLWSLFNKDLPADVKKWWLVSKKMCGGGHVYLR